MNVNRKCLNYILQSVIMVCLLNMIGRLAMHLWGYNLMFALTASMIFVLIIDIATALVWRWVASKHPNMMPSFITGVSGVRFLGALLMLLIGYLVLGIDGMSSFIVVFFVYYLASIIHHSIFFSRVSKQL